MKTHSKFIVGVVTVSAGLVLTGVSLVDAATITTNSIKATADINGGQDIQTGFPIANANKTQTFGSQSVDFVSAEAAQGIGGFSQVAVNVNHSGFDATAASGEISTITNAAIAEASFTYHNTGTTTETLGRFDFGISDIELEVFNGGGGPIIPEARVFFTATATKNGSVIDMFNAEMTLTGAYNDFQIVNAQGFSGSINLTECFSSTCLRGDVSVADLNNSLSLGSLLAGESVTVETYLAVDSMFNGTEIGARAQAVDPNGGVFSFTTGGTPPAVPLPAAGWMLLSVLGGAFGLKRRASSI